MAKKNSNSKKTPRTLKNSGGKSTPQYLKGKTSFNPHNHPAYKRGVEEGKAAVAAHMARTTLPAAAPAPSVPWYGFIFKIRDAVSHFLNGKD